MPEVIRGIRSHENGASPALSRQDTPASPITAPTSPLAETPVSPLADSHQRQVTFEHEAGTSSPARPTTSREGRRRSSGHRRKSLDPGDRTESDSYYDSRAATKREFKRRATTLQDYYKENPTLLPQLPFTWHHGWRRYRLGLVIVLIFLDACIMPIALYYGMKYGGHVQGYIIFAIVTTLWGGPTYFEFAIRSFRLMGKSHFYRPLGQTSRWQFDITHWACVVVITAVTALFIVGSAPHIVWLRVLSMPGPAILYSFGGVLFIITMWSLAGWKAPFRISSTPKGGKVLPGVYYFIEDVVAVNANAGRPFREALAARYEASPRFRRMIWVQSIFWSVPTIILAVPLTVIAVIHEVPAPTAYGICWGVPFVWAGIWAVISVLWVRRDLWRESEEWELDCRDSKDIMPVEKKEPTSPGGAEGAVGEDV